MRERLLEEDIAAKAATTGAQVEGKDADLPARSPLWFARRALRRCLNRVNSHFVVAAPMAGLAWLNKGQTHFSSHDVKYLPLTDFLPVKPRKARASPAGPREPSPGGPATEVDVQRILNVGNNGQVVYVGFMDHYNRRGPAGSALGALSPYDYWTAVDVRQGTSGEPFNEGHLQSETHSQVLHKGKQPLVGFAPWHKTPRRPTSFWSKWVYNEMDYRSWTKLGQSQQHQIGTYAYFIVTAFSSYTTRNDLITIVDAQPMPCDSNDESALPLRWLRTLRVVVRPVHTTGVLRVDTGLKGTRGIEHTVSGTPGALSAVVERRPLKPTDVNVPVYICLSREGGEIQRMCVSSRKIFHQAVKAQASVHFGCKNDIWSYDETSLTLRVESGVSTSDHLDEKYGEQLANFRPALRNRLRRQGQLKTADCLSEADDVFGAEISSDLYENADQSTPSWAVKERWASGSRSRAVLDNVQILHEGGDEKKVDELMKGCKIATQETREGSCGGAGSTRSRGSTVLTSEEEKAKKEDMRRAATLSVKRIREDLELEEEQHNDGAWTRTGTIPVSITTAFSKLDFQSEQVATASGCQQVPDQSTSLGIRLGCKDGHVGRLCRSQSKYYRPILELDAPPPAGNHTLGNGTAASTQVVRGSRDAISTALATVEDPYSRCTLEAELQKTLQNGYMDKKTGDRHPVNMEQGRGVIAVVDVIHARLRGDKSSKPLRMVLCGPPGTGKSVVIEAVMWHAKRLNSGERIRVAAPTGKAAALVRGNTLASVAGAQGYAITDAKLEPFWCGVWVMIIDEAFMVSLLNLGIALSYIWRILHQTELGLVFVGDVYQFAPVSGMALYKSAAVAHSTSAKCAAAFEKERGNWRTDEGHAYDIYRECTTCETVESTGTVVWLTEMKRTEGLDDWNDLLYLLRTYFTERRDGTVLEEADKRDAVSQVATSLAKMQLGQVGRSGEDWNQPIVITPRREVARAVGRELLLRHAASFVPAKRVLFYTCHEHLVGTDFDSEEISKFSTCLSVAIGKNCTKATNVGSRELVLFQGMRARITKNNTEDNVSLHSRT